MTKFSVFLSDFQSLRPAYESTQEETLRWLIDAHCQAESLKTPSLTKEETDQFRRTLEERLLHVGCKPDKIAKRGHSFNDFLHRDWSKMRIYKLDETASGVSQTVRSEAYDKLTGVIFDRFYEKSQTPPHDLIHVSCTGYTAPSGAQRLVSKKDWGSSTHVTHAYHMGCYASMPAIRMAKGFLASSFAEGKASQADIVHTEICSLHTNPSLHKSDQLVTQSLFADGFIKYTASSKLSKGSAIKLLCVHEEVIPGSMHSMSWNIADWGFELSLAKDVPVRIVRALKDYLNRLFAKADMPKELYQKALFAIHPGGPKILQHVSELMNLEPCQITHSQKVLYEYGNMSSATIPHIWQKILDDTNIEKGTPIVSLAFGPGLSVCGALMEKC